MGRRFDPEKFLRSSSLTPIAVWKKGEPRFKLHPEGARHRASGFNVDVSKRTWRHLRHQGADATKFLVKHRRELRRLARFPGVEDVFLDFPLDLRIDHKTVVVQSDHLDRALVSAAGSAGVGISITLYPVDLEQVASKLTKKKPKA